MTSEQWRPVVGWEGFYAVSSFGCVKSLSRLVGSRWASYSRPITEAVLTPKINANGYEQVGLNRNGRISMRLVHRLVLESFVRSCPLGMVGCHNDGDRRNNNIRNLRWDTPSENVRDTIRHGRNFNKRKTHCIHGHELTPENTYVYADAGKRGCRACRAVAQAKYRQNRENAA